MSQLQEYVDSQVATISPFKVKSQELLSDAKGSGNNAAPATERYAEDDAKATKTTTNQAANPVEDVDLDTPIDLSEIPF